MRIFMGLGNTAGYNTKLQKGFDELNIPSYILDLDKDPFQYSNSANLYIRLLRYLFHNKMSNSLYKKIIFHILYKICLFPIFLWTIVRFDVFIFGYNSSFFKFLDLPILKLLNKKIIYIYFGSDSRPPYMNGVIIKGKKWSIDKIYKETVKRKKKIKIVEKYADIIINHPACGQFHDKNYINWLCIGMPTIISKNTIVSTQDNSKILVVHAPSRPLIKGSIQFEKYIKPYIEKKQIEYVELINKPHKMVLETLQKCDFVLDELYSDSPLGGLSSEAASYKKISIVGGYYHNEMKNDIESKYIPPTLYCLPEEIENNIHMLINNHHMQTELGSKIYDFIEKNWSHQIVAKKILKLIDGTYPLEWIYETKNNSYIYGYGLHRDEIKKSYKQLIDKYGIKALCLNNKPKMIENIMRLVYDRNEK